jgi:hypothetical protein
MSADAMENAMMARQNRDYAQAIVCSPPSYAEIVRCPPNGAPGCLRNPHEEPLNHNHDHYFCNDCGVENVGGMVIYDKNDKMQDVFEIYFDRVTGCFYKIRVKLPFD